MPIQWNPELFKTGIEIIDNQHQELFITLSKLYDSYSKGEAASSITEMIEFLGTYSIEHFKTEEDIMISYKCPEYELHKREHEKFILDYMELKAIYEKEGSTKKLMLLIYNKVYKWLVEHTSTEDKKIINYIPKTE